jgi:hypothetical protein
LTEVRIIDNQVSVFVAGRWETSNYHAWNEFFRCHALAPHNPECAERAKQIRAALKSVGYIEKEAA